MYSCRQCERRFEHAAKREMALRKALEAAKNYIGNGYHPPELMEQINAALGVRADSVREIRT